MISKGSFITLGSIDSTNNFALEAVRSGMAAHGMTWFARFQSSGKGQLGKKWESAPGENIIMSTAFQPGTIFQEKLFHFNALISLVCLKLLKEKTGLEIKLKWPNDLYVGDKKLGGILIENIFRGNSWNWSVVGIGINVNQCFSDHPDLKASSIFDLTGEKNDPEALAKELHIRLMNETDNCNENMIFHLTESYNNHLYKKDDLVRLKKGNLSFETIVTGVDENGLLKTKANGVEKRFQNGELEWLI